MLDKSDDDKRIYMEEVSNVGRQVPYPAEVINFLAFERMIEETISQNFLKQSASKDYDLIMRKFDDLETKSELAYFKEDIKLLKVKVIFHIDNSESKFDACQRILRKVNLDIVEECYNWEKQVHKRKKGLLAECSMIKAIIIKMKSGSYLPGSDCSELMKFIAKKRFDAGHNAYRQYNLHKFDDKDDILHKYINNLKSLKRHFDKAAVHSIPYKTKSANSCELRNTLLQTLEDPITKELSGIQFRLADDLPGSSKNWFYLFYLFGSIASTSINNDVAENFFTVARDPQPHDHDRTATDLMDTTITVVMEDLIN